MNRAVFLFPGPLTPALQKEMALRAASDATRYQDMRNERGFYQVLAIAAWQRAIRFGVVVE